METMDNNTISSTHQEKAKKMRKLRRWQIIVSLFGVAVIVWGVIEIVFLFLGYKQTETSNDAQIEQYVSPVNLRASGYINKIYFTEHQQVRKGDTLLVLDDREYKIRSTTESSHSEADTQFYNDRCRDIGDRTFVSVDFRFGYSCYSVGRWNIDL